MNRAPYYLIDRVGLVAYLQEHGLDANRIAQEPVTEEGYEYLPSRDDASYARIYTEPMSGARREERQWPSPEVGRVVMLILSGLSRAEAEAAVAAKEPKKPVKGEKAKKEETNGSGE